MVFVTFFLLYWKISTLTFFFCTLCGLGEAAASPKPPPQSTVARIPMVRKQHVPKIGEKDDFFENRKNGKS